QQQKIEHYSFVYIVSLFLLLILYTIPVMADFEKLPILNAQSILSPQLFKGKYHSVKKQVKNDGLFNHYVVNSKFGTFNVTSTTDLKILVNELNAIADMKKIDIDDTAISGLKKSGNNMVSGLKTLWNKPKETVKGAADGATSLFNRAKETVGSRKSGHAEDSTFEQLVGISKSKGIIASKYHVNVYSHNEVLQEQLDRLGRADFAGGLGVSVATSFVPGVGGLILSTSSTTRILNDTINNTPASKLWVDNKHKLEAMGMNTDITQLFLNNPFFSPTLSTLFVASLDKMKGVENRVLFMTVALQASNTDMAKMITRISIMTAGYHKNVMPLKKITTMGRVTQAIRKKDNTRIVLLPADYIVWNKLTANIVTEITNESKGGQAELWVVGSVSQRVMTELKKLNWKVMTQAQLKLVKK
ncbi:MAG: hypothetical protein KAI02_04225, partial [Gammaproteobacteria bacterium]|nr:hypothetical protein [Gammaproteobacteria bacterium]